MQKHAFEPFLGQSFVECEIAVFLVAGDGVAQMRAMHPNLVRSSRLKFCFEQTKIFPARNEAKNGMRRFAFVRHTNSPLTRRQQILEQRQLTLRKGSIQRPLTSTR